MRFVEREVKVSGIVAVNGDVERVTSGGIAEYPERQSVLRVLRGSLSLVPTPIGDGAGGLGELIALPPFAGVAEPGIPKELRHGGPEVRLDPMRRRQEVKLIVTLYNLALHPGADKGID